MLDTLDIRHIFASRCHPQTCGKIERLNRTAEDRLDLVIHPTPEELQQAVVEFCDWYNNERYHEAIGNVRPIDMYEGRAEKILRRRKALKRKTIQNRRESNLLTA